MNRKKIFTAILTIALCVAMTAPAYAVYDPMKAMEAASRQAVETAIKAGTVPPGTTIYDCAYSTDENGVTIVVRYKDTNGNWIDITTQKPVVNPPAVTADTAPKTAPLTETELRDYADKVFDIVNRERENAGLDPLERSDYLDDAADIRAAECASVNSIRVNGQAHTRPDGSRWFTVLGISKNYNYGENTGEGKTTPEAQMASWMKSDGHKKNILREDYTEIGIGVAISEQGKVYAVQIFSRP